MITLTLTLTRSALAATLTAALFLGACSSTPVATTPAAQPAAAPVVQAAPPAAEKSPTTSPIASTPIAPYLDPQSALYRERSVYFDFDEYVVKPESTRLMELHGKYLAAHPSLVIKIEGNTDEQGGVEYNLALGQKRAEAVRKVLAVYGVKETQMEAVSFGKEKPKATGHDETAHAQNRRADLAYPAK